MKVSHTPVDKPTPPDVWTALNNLPQRVSILLKKYESSNAGGFEDFERELHALFAQTQCAVTRLVPVSVGVAPSAWLAKCAAEANKPDAAVVWRRDDLPAVYVDLKLEDLPGAGPRI